MSKSKTILDFFVKTPSNKDGVTSRKENCSSSQKKPTKITGNTTGAGIDRLPVSKQKLSLDKPVTAASENKILTEESPGTKKTPPLSVKRKLSKRNGENAHLPGFNSTESLLKSENDVEVKKKESNGNGEMDLVSPKSCGNDSVSGTSPTETPKQSKRRRIVIASDSDDSADEYKPEKESESDDTMSEHSSLSDSESPEKKKKKTNKSNMSVPVFDAYKFDKDSVSAANVTPKSSTNCSPPTSLSNRTSKCAQSPNSSFNLSLSSTPKSSLSKSSDLSNQNNGADCDKSKYVHERLEWLKPENIKDKCGRRQSHPDYDPETLYVPESFKKTLTPGLKQWWDLKSDHFNTVLFFKVGKFYEFYHMDAAIGVKELDLSYMKGDFAHAGFPEIAFGKFSDILIQKGYKVARIEQTETPQMMEQRCKKMHHPTKYDKVVKREICQVTSKGTRTLSYEEWFNNMGESNNFLLAICEKRVEQDVSASEYGICFVDTTIGKFTLGQFTDDRHQSRLLSFVGMYPPIEILFDKASVSQKTLKLFDSNLTGVSKQALASSLFWDAAKTLKFMAESGYYEEKGDGIQFPEAILQMLDKDDRLYQTPLKEYELAFKALGACIWYLKRCFIEDCLLTMKLFEIYNPVDETSDLPNITRNQRKYMILDNVTLHNLAIIPSQSSLKSEETLFGTLNYCETSFGKRELRKWLCAPLCQPAEIYDRLQAIDDLKDTSVFNEARNSLRKLPDLERLLNKIHVHGLPRNKDHPESRAIFYEMEVYNKRKIGDLLSALEGFKEAANISSLFEPLVSEYKSEILKKCISTTQGIGQFPPMMEMLSYFSEAFDHKAAVKQGSIIPRPGVDENYDLACQEIENTIEELNSYRDIQSSKLNCQIKFVNVGKNRYLLEVPENKKFPSEYEFLGGRKGFKRFYTKDIKELLSNLTSAEEDRDSALRDTTRRIFEQFDKHYTMWQRAVQCLSVLDVLLSMTNYYRMSDGKLCRPVFRTDAEDSEPYLEIIEGRHPTFVKYYTGKDYIPNSVYIGKKEDSRDTNKGGMLVLVTGPNMGGKSTLMRQTGNLLIMAHLGCYVPAESMVLTPVDRIFTRVGANDQIYKGESTFFVESSETASILHHATRQSFVLIDELGRGTATYDGTAIAYATADFLANDIGCRTLFSTHYHSLVEDFRNNPNVGLGHMACMVEDDNDCPTLEKVTFLYKFVDGACPKSYGFNVALLAGINKEIVRKGFHKSQQMDYGTKISKCLRKLLAVRTPKEIIDVLDEKLDAILNE